MGTDRAVTIYLHAGTHKTGSKSFQSLLAENRDDLARVGYDVFHGAHRNPRNHVELHLASLRIDRDSLAKHNWPDMVLGPEYEERVRQSVRSFLHASTLPHQVFSNEDLAFLRHADEFARLLDLFGRPPEDFVVIIALRNPRDFLRSFRGQILKKPGRVPSADPASALYVEPDSWLLDYDALVGKFRDAFGHVRIVNYDDAVARDGSILPELLRAIDVDPVSITRTDFRLNVT